MSNAIPALSAILLLITSCATTAHSVASRCGVNASEWRLLEQSPSDTCLQAEADKSAPEEAFWFRDREGRLLLCDVPRTAGPFGGACFSSRQIYQHTGQGWIADKDSSLTLCGAD